MATVRTPAPERDRHLAGFISRCAALDAAHQNLVVAGFRVLRNDNAHRERRFYGASAEREIVKEPVYDVKVLDRLVGRVAREVRLECLSRRSQPRGSRGDATRSRSPAGR
jgi:hypothetical protein